MLVNVGVIPSLTGKDDYIIWDELKPRLDSGRSTTEFLKHHEIQAQQYGVARKNVCKVVTPTKSR